MDKPIVISTFPFPLTYEEYLHTELWKIIRSRVIARDNHQCAICKIMECPIDFWCKANYLMICDEKYLPTTNFLVVHHRQYDTDTLHGRTLEHLVTLCQYHHKDIHGMKICDKRIRLTLEETNKRLDDEIERETLWSNRRAMNKILGVEDTAEDRLKAIFEECWRQNRGTQVVNTP